MFKQREEYETIRPVVQLLNKGRNNKYYKDKHMVGMI